MKKIFMNALIAIIPAMILSILLLVINGGSENVGLAMFIVFFAYVMPYPIAVEIGSDYIIYILVPYVIIFLLLNVLVIIKRALRK